MCKIGDIIVIKNYIGEDGREISQHSFIVIDDTPSEICGLNYDIVTNVMSSFKNNNHKRKKLRYRENIEITSNDILSNNKNDRSGFIKADQLIYFNKNKIQYYVLGHIDEKLLDRLLRVIIELQLEGKLKDNISNLIHKENQNN